MRERTSLNQIKAPAPARWQEAPPYRRRLSAVAAAKEHPIVVAGSHTARQVDVDRTYQD